MMRLMLGDTGDGSPSSTTCIFADEELAYFYTEGHGNPHLAAHHACVAAANKYSKMADRTLGPMSISYSQIADNYRKQAAEEFDNATNSANVSPEPYSFTSETGTRDTTLEDSSTLTVPAKFYRDQYENGQTTEDRQHNDW
jgi:hypothetical protein